MKQTLVEKLRSLGHWGTYRDFLSHYLGGLFHRADEHHIFLLAGGLAFSLFVCVVPLVLIVFSVLGGILERPSVLEEITSFIDGVIPYQEYSTYVKDFVVNRVIEFKAYKNLARIIGIAGLLFAASGLFSSMRTILSLAFRARHEEAVLIGKLRDFGFIVLVIVYFLLSTMLLPAFELIKEYAHKFDFLHSLRFSVVENAMFAVFSLAVIFVAFLVVYYAVPHDKPPKRVIIVSALSAAILWEVAKQVFGFYITSFITLKRIYGAYTLAIVVAFWIYYTSLVFILGAEIGQLYRERRRLKRLEMKK